MPVWESYLKGILRKDLGLKDRRIQRGGEETGPSAVKGCQDEGVLLNTRKSPRLMI